MERAIGRKAKKREGAAPMGFDGCCSDLGMRATLTDVGVSDLRSSEHSKIKLKGLKCGASLSDEEVRCFREFLRASS